MSQPNHALRLALIGYGKMGKEVERAALERGNEICARIDLDSASLSTDDVRRADVAVHFAIPSTVLKHIEELANLRKPVVVGTTGWMKDAPSVRSMVEAAGIGLVHASNFSIGVNIVYRLLREAGSLFDRFEEYDASVHEVHHKDKLDTPSGTALSIADVLLGKIRRKKEVLSGSPQGKIRPEQLHVTSARCGAVVGTHTVTFDSLADSIAIIHTAKNRTGFALGAVVAAEWVKDKKGMFTFEDVLEDLFKQQR
ncbi:MAG: 4-hydroxy-tetrahydrodipicolinate reductase [Ignavibacteriales bacterium]|nr:4-hydroxy-tetrahydrodipicolinate reductase [Ignavibacteriales bacterium]